MHKRTAVLPATGKPNDELKSLATNKGLASPSVLGAENQKSVDELSKKMARATLAKLK